MSDYDYYFFGDIQERLDFVSEKPTSEERRYGIMDYNEYIKWLREKKEKWLLNDVNGK